MKIGILKDGEIERIKDLVSIYEFNDYRTYRMLNRDKLKEYLFSQISDFLKNKNSWVIVVEENREIVGLASLSYLLWDTRHFGFKMGKIGYLMARGDYEQALTIKNRLLAYLFQVCKKEKIVHLSCRVDIDDTSAIHALELNGFRLMDTLVTYAFIRNKHKIHNFKELYEVRRFRSKDLPTLIDIATNSFSNDRFHLDPYIPHKKADALFGEWIKNSCRRKETVFVTTRKDRPVGFLTYKLYEDLAKITNFKIMGQGLMAVVPQAKGALIGLMKATFSDVNLHYDCVEYDTRLNNYEVIKVCQRFGLDLVRAKYTFHRWLR